jgi:hypothetical protein
MSIATVGLDIAKQFFQVHGVDANGGWPTLCAFAFLQRVGDWSLLHPPSRFPFLILASLRPRTVN